MAIGVNKWASGAALIHRGIKLDQVFEHQAVVTRERNVTVQAGDDSCGDGRRQAKRVADRIHRIADL